MTNVNNVTPLVVPQVNVNDETVKLVRWRVTDNGKIAEGDLVCEVETTKAVAEVYAPASGILRQIVPVGVHVRVGEAIGAIGPTSEAVAAYLTATCREGLAGRRHLCHTEGQGACRAEGHFA